MNIETQYIDLCKEILEKGTPKSDRTGTGTLSVFGKNIQHDMKNGFPLLTTKKMAWKTIVSELLWFLKGRTDLKWLLERNNYIWLGDAYKNYSELHKKLDGGIELSKQEFVAKILHDENFSNIWGNLGRIYGHQWRKWGRSTFGHDQIWSILHLLEVDPDSRRMLVTAWNPDELGAMVLPPCHYSFQVYTKKLSENERWNLYSKDNDVIYHDHIIQEMDEKNVPKRSISLLWNQRSADVPLGLPFNIASYALLLEIFAKMVNMVPDKLIGNLGDCHIYNNQIEGIEQQITRIPYDLPKLKVNEEIDFTIKADCIFDLDVEDFQIENYIHYEKIYFPLSN